MFKLPAFLFSICIPFLLCAQRQITGTVVNPQTNEAVVGASVFISNTSKGTVSSANGTFELNDIPTGKHDLVVSSVGYETNVFSFSTDQLPLKVRIELKLKVKELANVIIEPSLEEDWEKWGKTFTETFVGLTPNAMQCRIKNGKSIRFRFYKKSNRLIAYSDERIVLENRALGYRIIYQLENFEINFKEGSSAYAGYPLFEDMDEAKKKVRTKWTTARDKAYYGSMMHFMRSVYRHRSSKEGFEIRRMKRIPNLEKARIREWYRTQSTTTRKDPATGQVNIINVLPSKDSEAYYQRVLREKDYKEEYGQTLLSEDSLRTANDGQYQELFFTDYLYITYKKEAEDKAYLIYQNEKRSPTFQQSFIWLPNQSPFVIDVNGSYFPPQDVYSLGYWGWDEKMANTLPLDFMPYELQR